LEKIANHRQRPFVTKGRQKTLPISAIVHLVLLLNMLMNHYQRNFQKEKRKNNIHAAQRFVYQSVLQKVRGKIFFS